MFYQRFHAFAELLKSTDSVFKVQYSGLSHLVLIHTFIFIFLISVLDYFNTIRPELHHEEKNMWTPASSHEQLSGAETKLLL